MTKRIEGRIRATRNARILKASSVCWICGEPGADGVDHVIPLARGGTEHPSNLRPAHHKIPNSQGRRCNLEKGTKDYAPIVRRSGSLC
jgi:5-methylcytosine-specific restriction endonuclease McrA